jgi:hypothetical protein
MSATVTLNDEQLELVRRETMKATARDLVHLAKQLDELATIAPWPDFPLNADIHNALEIARESLGTLDALGWPPKDRGE